MTQRFIRIYKKLDITEVQNHILILGDLSGICGKCQHLGLKVDSPQCPACRGEFKYIAFRNIKNHLPKMKTINETRPDIIFVDYDDYKRITGALKAEKFFE